MNIAIIPARGGSKGLPRKNILPLKGRPLISYSIQSALQAESIDRVYVTTDDREIKLISQAEGATVIDRPDSISGDTATSESALKHALAVIEKEIDVSHVFFLQCTSPLRPNNTLDLAFEKFMEGKFDSMLSVCENHRFIWKDGQNSLESINYDYQNRSRRQDFETQYMENGSFYIFHSSILKKFNNRLGGKVGKYIMPEYCSQEIDTAFDFKLVSMLMEEFIND